MSSAEAPSPRTPVSPRAAFPSPARRLPGAGLLLTLPFVAGLLLAGAPSGLAAQEAVVLESLDTGGLEATSAALILSGQEGGELGVSALAVPVPPGEGELNGRLLLQVDLEGGPLMEQMPEDAEDLLVEIHAYALAEGGAIGAFLTRAFRVELEEYGNEVLARGIKFLGSMEIPPGEYRLQVLTRNRQTQRFNLQSLPIAVGGPGDEPRDGLLMPFFPEDPERWVQVRTEGSKDLLWSVGGKTVVPSTFPVLRSDRDEVFYLLGRGLEGDVTGRMLDLDRQPVQDAELDLGGAGAGAPAPLGTRQATLGATGLRPGQYFLELTEVLPPETEEKKKKKGEEEAEPRVTALPVVVLPPEAGEEMPLWSQLRSEQPVPTEAPRAEEAAQVARQQRVQLSRWLSAYREALLDAEPTRQAARGDTLTRLEQSQLTGQTAKGRFHKGVDQLTAAKVLGGETPESLVPLIRFHEWRYRDQHRSHSYLLATHARQMAVQLADAYVDLSRSEGARRIAAANLVSIGGYLQEVGSVPSALNAFEKALDYEKTNVGALLGVGTILEADIGDYEGAAATFRRLLKVQPRNQEVRLRLAVNLVRTGHAREAERLLRQILDVAAPPWVTVVAYQELASLLVDDRRADKAVELLQTAVNRFPEQQRLYLQLASIYDSLRRPAAAKETLARMDPRAGRRAASPRLVYWTKPTWAIDLSRQFLEENAQNRLPVLADTLMALVPEEGPSDAGS